MNNNQLANRFVYQTCVMRRLICFISVLFLTSLAFAQNTRSVDTPKPPRPAYQSAKKERKGSLAFLKKKNKPPKSEVEEFRSRLQKVYKQKAKEEKLSDKARYKDPSYFGHKKPPKKRPVGKQKFCKVCKIKH